MCIYLGSQWSVVVLCETASVENRTFLSRRHFDTLQVKVKREVSARRMEKW